MTNTVIIEYFKDKGFKKKALGGKDYFYFLDFPKEERLIFLVFSELFNREISQIGTMINYDPVSRVAVEVDKIWRPKNDHIKTWRYSTCPFDYFTYYNYTNGIHFKSPVFEGDCDIRAYKFIEFVESVLFPFYNKFIDPRSIFGYFKNNENLINKGTFLWFLLILRKLYDHPQYGETWDLISTWYDQRKYQEDSMEVRLKNIYWEIMRDVKPIYEWKDEYLDPNTTYPGTIIK